MKRRVYLLLTLTVVVLLVAGLAAAGTIKSAGVNGVWTDQATWVGGVVPGPADIAVIADRDTVTYNAADATVAGLQVGEGASGILQFSKSDSTKLRVNGNILVSTGATFKVQSNTILGNLVHRIYLTGDLTNNGAAFDMRSGSTNSTLSVAQYIFTGSTNSTVSTSSTYSSSANEFNGWTIDKSGSGKVILATNVYIASGSTSALAAQVWFEFKRGKVETGNNTLVHLSTTSATVFGASDSSYVIGAMARGASSSTSNKDYPIGDANGYRPVRVRTVTGNASTGHYITARCIPGNASIGASGTFSGGIDKVSAVRYYQVNYFKGTTSTATLKAAFYTLSYGLNDGVAAGNTSLRVAHSTDNRASWIGNGPTAPPTTALDSLPRLIVADSLATALDLTDGGAAVYLALARATGTTQNSLEGPGTAVEPIAGELPSRFSVSQNYPNPFNPSTMIEYSLPQEQPVTVKVFSLLGQEVATLVSTVQPAGTYRVTFDASSLTSGMYVYQVRAGALMESRRMMLVK